MATIRDAAKEFATAIVDNAPAGADRDYAIMMLRQVVMTANQAIACE